MIKKAMEEFYRGEDIPFTITGGDAFDLDKDNFDVWHYVCTNKACKVSKSEMKRIDINTYQGIIRGDISAKMGTGDVTMEVWIADVSHGIRSILKAGKQLKIKNSIMGAVIW